MYFLCMFKIHMHGTQMNVNVEVYEIDSINPSPHGRKNAAHTMAVGVQDRKQQRL